MRQLGAGGSTNLNVDWKGRGLDVDMNLGRVAATESVPVNMMILTECAVPFLGNDMMSLCAKSRLLIERLSLPYSARYKTTGSTCPLILPPSPSVATMSSLDTPIADVSPLSGFYSWTDTLRGVYYGPGSVKTGLPKLLNTLGIKKALIVTGKSLYNKASYRDIPVSLINI